MKITSSRKLAFTLIELLVVIAIIAILAAILLPVIGRVRDQADSTKCLSNMKQIAAAMVMYSNDNEQRLPGPLKAEQYPTNNPEREGSLQKLLDPYLMKAIKEGKKVDDSLQTTERTNIFICPSYAKLYKRNELPVFLVNTSPIEELEQSAWGDANKSQEPVKRSMLTTWTADQEGKDRPVELSKLWALIDADEGVRTLKTPINPRGTPMDFAEGLPPRPVHGDHRNVIYFDMHAAKLQTEEEQNK